MNKRLKPDHDLHIHSYLSTCSRNPEQNVENILKYAKDNGLRTVCITDHFWDEKIPCGSAEKWYSTQNYSHVAEILPLPKDSEVKFLFGCEADMDKNMTVGLSRERAELFDFIVISTTHLHMHSPEPDNSDPEFRAKLWVERLDALFNMDLPFRKIGVAHLTCILANRASEELFKKTLEHIPDRELERVFAAAARLGVGIELNMGDMVHFDLCREEFLRIYGSAKRCGCKFYFGSDSHNPEEFEGFGTVFDEIVELLSLTEDDVFVIGN